MVYRRRFVIKYILLILFTNPVFASDCICIAKLDSVIIFQNSVKSESACKESLADEVYKRYQNKLLCENDGELKAIHWTCQRDRKKSLDFKLKKVSCKEMLGLETARSLLSAGLVSQLLLSLDEINVGHEIALNDKCEKDNETLSEIQTTNSKGKKIRLDLESEVEARKILKVIIGGEEKLYSLPGDIFDKIEGTSFVFHLKNDNNMLDVQEGGDADDIGFTHGLKFSLHKKLEGTGYYLTVEYESNLYTNFQDSLSPNFTRDEEGNWHVSQHFIEENFGRILLEKEKDGDVFYWSIGGGIHTLNKDNDNGSIPGFSALSSQTFFHDIVNEVSPGNARVYDNVAQDGSENGLFVDTKLGKRGTILGTDRTRVYVQGETRLRGSTVEDASYVSADAGAFVDWRINSRNSARLGGGAKTDLYIDGSQVSGSYVEIGVGNEDYSAKFRYDMVGDATPGYQNALPKNFSNREIHIPVNENMWEISLEYKW